MYIYTNDVKHIYYVFLIIFVNFFLLNGYCYANNWKGVYKNESKTVFVEYKVEEGYKVKLKIHSLVDNKVISRNYVSDVNSVDVEFLDISGDNRKDDVLLKLSDETGYTPLIFINDFREGYLEILNGVSYPLYVSTELDIDDKTGKATRMHTYLIKKKDNALSELIFFRVYVKQKFYPELMFRFNDSKDKLVQQ